MIGSVKGVRAVGKALGRQGWAGLPPLVWGGEARAAEREEPGQTRAERDDGRWRGRHGRV